MTTARGSGSQELHNASKTGCGRSQLCSGLGAARGGRSTGKVRGAEGMSAVLSGTAPCEQQQAALGAARGVRGESQNRRPSRVGRDLQGSYRVQPLAPRWTTENRNAMAESGVPMLPELRLRSVPCGAAPCPPPSGGEPYNHSPVGSEGTPEPPSPSPAAGWLLPAPQGPGGTPGLGWGLCLALFGCTFCT